MKYIKELQNFKKRFSPSIIKKSFGVELLKLIAYPKYPDSNIKEQFKNLYEENYVSLKNELENGMVDFGSGSAGYDINFVLAYRKGDWYNKKSKVTFEDAIQIAEQIKQELVRACEFLENDDFKSFYDFVSNSRSGLFNKGYTHKYFYILYPKYITFYHASTWQQYYKKCLELPKTKNKNYYDIEKYFIDNDANCHVGEKSKELEEKYGTPKKFKITEPQQNLNNKSQYIFPLNQILYGPPGTGKTYKLENIIKDYIYPQIADDHESTNIYDDILLNCDLNWVEKIIFAFKINNSQNKPLTDVQISKLPLIQRWFSISSNYKDEKSLICSIRGEMQKNAIRKEGVYARHENNYFERQENGFILIDDGEKLYNELCEHYDININSFDNNIQTDKSILAKDYYVFCTFHQSYSYEEFVEGIRPIINKSKQDETSKDKNLSTMQFDFHCGIFKDMCIKAKKEPNKKFFIFIDEINRGNISKIFGELITLIEKDKREKVVEDGREYHTIEVTLPYTNDRFTVPNNLYIVGTMNTADKSLALLDVALRRRFEFVPMYPKYDLKDLKHKEFLEALNDRIYFEKKSADFLIGHTYFLGSEAEDLSEVMNKKVTPLLMEYFNAKKEMVEDIVGPLLEKEGYCIDKNEKYLLKVVRK